LELCLWQRWAGLSKSVKNPSNPHVLNYAWHLKKLGRADTTIESHVKRLKRLSNLCNLEDPEQVKSTLAVLEWKNSTKQSVTDIYTGFLKFIGLTWQKPEYQKDSTLPFIPTEQEIDALISAGQPKTSALLQLLKETGARIGEVLKLEWTHIDTARKTVYITAIKGSNSRILPISDKLINMLKCLLKTNDKVFQTNQHGLRATICTLRKKTAMKLGNPRLNKIHYHTFRHWKGTMEYHKTKDIIHVQVVLGHKNIQSTMIYINLESAIFLSDSDEWTCKATANDKDAIQLIESGFEYVTTTPNGLMMFRKRK